MAHKKRLCSFLCLISENPIDATLESLTLNLLCSTQLNLNSKISTFVLFHMGVSVASVLLAAQAFGPNSEARTRKAIFLGLIKLDYCPSTWKLALSDCPCLLFHKHRVPSLTPGAAPVLSGPAEASLGDFTTAGIHTGFVGCSTGSLSHTTLSL